MGAEPQAIHLISAGADDGRLPPEADQGLDEEPHGREGRVKKLKRDQVNHPPHYNTGKIEVIEFIEDQRLTFHLGNAVKYISRAGKKNAGKVSEDLEKAIWYLRRHIETMKPNPRRPNEMPQERARGRAR